MAEVRYMKIKFSALVLCLALLAISACGCGLETPREFNPDYTAIFTENGIEDIDRLDKTDMSSSAECEYFAKVDEDGVVETSQYIAVFDKVYTEVSAIYYPIADYTDAQIASFDSAIKEGFADIEALEFIEATYTAGEKYYEIVFKITGLENSDNYVAAAKAGYYSGNPEKGDYISLKATEEYLLEEGFEQKMIVAKK